MKNRKSNPGHSALDYQTLEPRQLLASFRIDPLLANEFQHTAQNNAKIVATKMDAAPDIAQQPEHGKLIYDGSQKTLTYVPDEGFVGEDSFQLDNKYQSEYSIRVWESVYAVPDWVAVRPGESISIDALENDYAFKKPIDPQASPYWRDRFFWQQDSTDLRIVDFDTESGASISISQNEQQLSYEAIEGFEGEDVVTYTVEDANGNRTEGTITIEVSNRGMPGRYFVSEAQWHQQQIESWMQRNAQSFTHGFWHTNRRFDEIFVPPDVVRTQSVTLDRVTDIQEGDIVKSQGDLLYYVTQDDGSGEFASYLSIVDVSDPADPQLVSTTGFARQIRDVFLDGDRVAVVQQNGYLRTPIWFTGFQRQLTPEFQVVVMDVSDSQVPTEVYRATIDGSYSEARLMGDQLFVISDSDTTGWRHWELERLGWVNTPVSPGDYIDAMLEHEQNFGIPTITIDSNGESKTIAIGYDQIVDRDNTYQLTQLTTFDLQSDSGTPIDIDLIETYRVSTVYVSNDSMYLFDGRSVIKLDFQAHQNGIEFSADGELSGELVSQFAASEHDGYLRVAVNDFQDSSADVLIFEQIDDTLVLTSSIDNIAPGERIYSATFEGHKAYVVTFRRIDPLFVIDLSDHANPQISGELKVPGFSNYLQWIGDGLLLAVGRGSSTQLGQNEPLQVSLFDVSDSKSPQLLDRYSFEGKGSTYTPLIKSLRSSPEHHALTFDANTGTLSLPIFSATNWRDPGSELFRGDDSAIALFQVDRENGIQFSGQVDFDSKALRTLIVGDNLVYLSADGLKTASRLSPTEIRGTMEFSTDNAQQLAARPVTPPSVDETSPVETSPVDTTPSEIPIVDAPPNDAPLVDAPPNDAPLVDAPPVDTPIVSLPPQTGLPPADPTSFAPPESSLLGHITIAQLESIGNSIQYVSNSDWLDSTNRDGKPFFEGDGELANGLQSNSETTSVNSESSFELETERQLDQFFAESFFEFDEGGDDVHTPLHRATSSVGAKLRRS